MSCSRRRTSSTLLQWSKAWKNLSCQLSSAKKWSKGKYTLVYHFDSKADTVEYLKEKQAALWKKTNLIMIGIYLSNYLRGSFSEIKKVCNL